MSIPLIKRKIAVILTCEHLQNSPVFGDVTDEQIAEWIKEQLGVMLVDTDLHPAEGDIFKLSEPNVIMNQEQLSTVFIIHPDDMLPTDDESLLADFARDNTDIKYLEYERRCRELENDGFTRGDAQGVAGAEGLDPDQALLNAKLGRTMQHVERQDIGISKNGNIVQ
jgi:hypothetical protein